VISLADTYYELRGAEAALEHSRQSLGVLRELGNPALLGSGLNNLGEYCRELGKLDEAAECYREALDIWKSIGGVYVQGHVLQNLGRVYLESGQAGDAVASLTEAHGLHLASGDLMGQARTLRYLGQALYDSGRADEAVKSWAAALEIFEDLKAEAEAAAIRAMLTTLSRVAAGRLSRCRRGRFQGPRDAFHGSRPVFHGSHAPFMGHTGHRGRPDVPSRVPRPDKSAYIGHPSAPTCPRAAPRR
jgi:tetratricopeptide (TPR) repeat protein